MPTLDRNERQRLRYLQEHLLNQCLLAGADYTPISTVGTIFHPQLDHPDLNLIIPHRGVAWTRTDDVMEAFEYLKDHHRQPRFQFLEKLFPEAFHQQLMLKGLKPQPARHIWIYEPVQGPVLPDETIYGQAFYQPQNGYKGSGIHFSIRLVKTSDEMEIWRSFTHIEEDLIAPMIVHRWLGYQNDEPIAALQSTFENQNTEILAPIIQPEWQDFGFEKTLINAALLNALEVSSRMVYLVDESKKQASHYEALGFVFFTRLLTFA